MIIVREFEQKVLESGATRSNPSHRMAINQICRKYVGIMKEKYALNTCKNYMSLMKKIIINTCADGDRHPALNILRLTSAEYFRMKDEYRKKISQTSRDPIRFNDVDAYIETCENLIEGFNRNHISATKLAVGIAGLTGRRIVVEVICFGKVKPIDEDHILFSGQAKIRGNYVKPPYAIPALSDPEFIYDAWKLLRVMRPPVIPNEMKTADIIKLTTNSHRISMQAHQNLFKQYREEMKIIATKTANITHGSNAQTAKKCFSAFGVQKTSDLRAIYAEAAYQKFRPSGDRNTYYAEILGHDEYDYVTSQSYKKFRKK